MYTLYAICTFILSSSSLMIGYVWIRDIKNTRAQAELLMNQDTENFQETELSDEILAEYPNLIKRTA